MTGLAASIQLTHDEVKLLDAVQALVVVLDAGGCVVTVNAATEGATGFSRAELAERRASWLILSGDLGGPVPGTRATGSWRSRTGGPRRVSWMAEPYRSSGVDGPLTLLTGTDVTDEWSALEAQRAIEWQLRSVAASVPAILWAVDRDGCLTMMEGKGTRHLPDAPDALVGRSIFEALDSRPELLAHVRRGLAGESFSELIELAGRTFESRYEPLYDAAGTSVGLAGVAMDITEQRRSERALAQAQKMESLGVLAGSVAHDFNNLLTAILGFAGLIKLSPSLEDEEREHVYLIEQSARRGADIAGRLLSFARGGLARFVPVDLREVVNETVRLVRPTLHTGLQVSVALPAEAVTTEGDYGQLQQALLNILLNARDAMPCGGSIAVTLAAAQGRAHLTVADNGPGMDEETQSRIFEPFFTTKEAGVGTGLGLAISYGIIRGHGGEVTVDSSPGLGTRFVLSVPLRESVPPPPEAEAGDGNLVLVVDDDDIVRRSTCATLADLGYNVVEVGAGALAVEMVRARPGRFAAVLLDLVMPGMAGREVFHQLAALRPELPVVICTGYAAEGHIDDTMKRSVAGVLQKPCSAERLCAVLHEVGAEPVRRARARAGAHT
ncbi:MAG: response regulator [Dehalococcoidia bacterium]|nr:response regulator [Dehalococcoidia bacterium]